MFGAFLLDIVTLEGLLFFIIMQQSLLRFNLNVKFKALVTVIIGLLVYFLIEQNLKLEFLFILIYLFTTINDEIYLLKSSKFNFFSKIFHKNSIVLFLLFIFTLLLQNAYLEFETIDWDINSYLVSSQNVSLNNLPMKHNGKANSLYFSFFIKYSYFYHRKFSLL